MRRKKAAEPDLRSFQAAEAVLGSILMHAPAITEVELVPEDFDFEWQRLMYQTMLEMASRKESIDVVTVSERLEVANPAGSIEIPDGNTWLGACAALLRDTPTWRNIGTYAKVVKEGAVARAAITIGLSLAEGVAQDPEQVDEAVRELMKLRNNERRYSIRISEAIGPAAAALDDRCEGKTRTGIPTGFAKLDGLLGGMSPEHLLIIGARPAMGKTTMGMQLLLNNPTVASGFMSTEMPSTELVQRACGTISGVNAHSMRLGKVADEDWPRIASAYSKISQMPIYLNDKPGPTPFQVMRQARQWKYEHDIKIFVVDYIQHLKLADVRDKTSLLSEAVVGFKELARELKIPVVLLAQINRSVESRTEKRPNLGDFKDTGALEEEGDVVISLYRDEVYNPKNIDTRGVIEIAVLKHRHGPTGYFKATYNGACLRIEDRPTTPDAFD